MSINFAFRLLEAGPLKEALRASRADLALIISDWFYEEVVRHQPAGDPGAFRHVAVDVKETRTSGWVRLPGTAGASAPVTSGGPAPPAGPRQLPAAVRDFVGRAAELDTLDGLLAPRDDSVAIAVITGTAGVGKTALAVHAAHRVKDRFPDGQLYADLHGYAAEPRTSPQRALEGMLRALGTAAERIPADVDEQSALFRSLLDGRRMLVVLDNAFEAAQVRPLLPGTPGCAVIVTSRNTLSGLIAREGARALPLDRLSFPDAGALLRRLIGTERVDGEPEAAGLLMRRCSFLPLALRVAAERLRPRQSLADLVAELDERNRLDVLAAEDDDTTPRTVLSWSYDALPAPAARMFRLLALHPGPEISVPAATALAGTTTEETRLQLDTLVRAHLLEVTRTGRYRLTGLLRVYANELAGTEGNKDDGGTAVRRVLAWYLGIADRARRLLSPQRLTDHLVLPGGPAQPLPFTTAQEARQWCESERLNLMAAARYAAATGNHDIGWRLPLALWELFSLRGPWTDWVSVHHTALDSARKAEALEGEAWTLSILGYACQDRWLFEESANHLLRARPLFRELGDLSGEAWALHGLGLAVRRLQRFDEATVLHRETLRIATEIGDRRAQAWALGGLGFSYAGGRRYAESLDKFRLSLSLARQTDRRAEGWAQYGFGHAYQRLRQPDKAVAYYGPALEIFREIGDWPGQGETLDGLAKIQVWAGEREAARTSWTLAMEIFRHLRLPQESRIRDRLQDLGGEHAVDYPETDAAVPCP
jgi:tetratricopeptide (TPR) repeat protein